MVQKEALGFIGLGKMGFPMLTNLQKRFQVCTYDIDSSILPKVSELGNVTVLNSFLDFKNTNTIFLMLPNDEVVKNVCLGEDGIINVMPKNSNIYDCSTISLQTSDLIYNSAKQYKINYIDCPVSGGLF
jgi:3-hydroxyisobutyrate dehydrogenase-like beta-hydroxyacid dehydrogenase